MSTTPDRSGTSLARVTQIVALGTLLGLFAGLLFFWVELASYTHTRDYWKGLLADGLQQGVLVGLGFALLGSAAFTRIGKLRDGSLWYARLLTVLLLLPPFLLFLLRLNRLRLPGMLEMESLIGNGAAGLGFLVASEALARGLRAWHQGPWRSHASYLVPAVLLALIPIGAHFYANRPRRDPGPDVLFILLDVLRADHLGCYGYERPTSPNIDKLAKDSILFENFVSASSYTKTSIASMFTGLDAHLHGVLIGSRRKHASEVTSDVLAARFTTLAEAMFDRGLNTAAWIENGQLRPFLGYAQGFAKYVDQPGTIDVITAEFATWLDKWGSGRRYFAYLHAIDLHGPYQPKPPYLGRFGGLTSLATGKNHLTWYDFKDDVRAGKIVLTEEDYAGLEAKYDELLAYTDAGVGRIIANLKASGRYDNTLIVLTSDHGEGFGEHGFIAHSNLPHEELVHVPLLIKLPNSEGAGRRVPNLVGHVDLAPTLIDYVGGKPLVDVSGESFLPLVTSEGAELEPRWRYIQHTGSIGIRTERWKLIASLKTWPEGVKLYDMLADPDELKDCAAEYPDVTERLTSAVATALRISKSTRKAERIVLDQETIDSLEALGYL